jgi:hypothetical protein
MIEMAGSMVLKIMLPETTIEELQDDLARTRNAINNIYIESKIVVKKTILHTHDISRYVLTMEQEELRRKLLERAQAIKDATGKTLVNTLEKYNSVIKVAVVVVAGTAILYVAPAAVGLTATILPPLYTTSMTGLQLVGSMCSYGGKAIGYGGYVAVNNVFYPTARAAIYMLSRVLGNLIIGNTIRINQGTMEATTTNEVTNFIFGNGAMWLPLDQSIGPALQVVSEQAAVVAQGFREVAQGFHEVGEVVTPFVRHNVNELAYLIYHNPNIIGAFATLTVAATSSAAVANAINEAKNNTGYNTTSHLRGYTDKILLNTPQNSPPGSPRISSLDNAMENWFNELSAQEQSQLETEYANRQLTQGEKDAEEFKEEYRKFLIGRKKGISGEIIRQEDIDRDRRIDKLTYMLVIKDRMDKEKATKVAENAGNNRTDSDELRGAETKAQPNKGLFGFDMFNRNSKGGSKKKRKETAKKSTRKHKKKSGKKGKSNKKKVSNKKRRHTRR